MTLEKWKSTGIMAILWIVAAAQTLLLGEFCTGAAIYGDQPAYWLGLLLMGIMALGALVIIGLITVGYVRYMRAPEEGVPSQPELEPGKEVL